MSSNEFDPELRKHNAHRKAQRKRIKSGRKLYRLYQQRRVPGASLVRVTRPS